MNDTAKITIIGYGKMGSALLEGWLNDFPDYEFGVVEPNDLKDALSSRIKFAPQASDISDFITSSNIVVMAVKPQVMESVCKEIKPYLNQESLVLSIAAGQSIGNFETYFGDDTSIIRSMPNTPAAIGKGMSVAVANNNVHDTQKELADALLKSTGTVEWIDDESLLDAVTAVSGSGPAYVFYLIEALAEAAKNAGLPENLSETLARQTVIGAAALAEQNAAIAASKLRENVTSPGGTTAAALSVLMNGEMQKLFNDAVQKATERGKELNTLAPLSP